MQPILLCIARHPYLGIFTSLGLGILGLPIPDETVMAFAGFLVYQDKLNFANTILVAFIGTTCGITIGYLLGKIFGNTLLDKYIAKVPGNQSRIQKAEDFYRKYGKFALLIGYFIPGVRHFTAIFAGTSRMAYRTFALFAFTGGILWTITFVSIGYFLGEKWRRVYMYSNRFIIPFVIAGVVFLLIAIYWKTTGENRSLDENKNNKC